MAYALLLKVLTYSALWVFNKTRLKSVTRTIKLPENMRSTVLRCMSSLQGGGRVEVQVRRGRQPHLGRLQGRQALLLLRPLLGQELRPDTRLPGEGHRYVEYNLI